MLSYGRFLELKRWNIRHWQKGDATSVFMSPVARGHWRSAELSAQLCGAATYARPPRGPPPAPYLLSEARSSRRAAVRDAVSRSTAAHATLLPSPSAWQRTDELCRTFHHAPGALDQKADQNHAKINFSMTNSKRRRRNESKSTQKLIIFREGYMCIYKFDTMPAQ